MKILHIAPYNTSGVPLTLVRTERELGHQSRLLTFHRDWRGYEEDICLELPGWNQSLLGSVKRVVYTIKKREQSNREINARSIPPVWEPGGFWEAILLRWRDMVLRPAIDQAIRKHRLDNFDVYQLDGGHGFFRFHDIIPKWHKQGRKIICCYYGSDLRKRGVMPEINAVSDCNITMEWDHLDLYPGIYHVFYPFDHRQVSSTQWKKPEPGNRLMIGHSPTNRQAKGSEVIINAVRRLAQKYPVELLLIENVPYRKNLELRSRCHLGIDQLGDLGYGISALEWLAMGIPVATCLARRMQEVVKEHPFTVIDENNIGNQLETLICRHERLKELGLKGRQWLEEYHDPIKTVNRIHKLAGLN